MKKFFNKIVLFLNTLFDNLDEWIHEHVQPSIEMVERIKAVVASPVGNLIAALIPGGIGEAARDELIDILTKAINAMHVTADIVNEPDWTNKVSKTIAYIRTLSNPMKNAIYLKLASEMAKIKSGSDSFKGHSVDLLTQMQYSKMVEGVWADSLPNETIVNGEVQTEPSTTEVTQESAVADQTAASVSPVIAPAVEATPSTPVAETETAVNAVVDAVAPSLAAPVQEIEKTVQTVENVATEVAQSVAPTPTTSGYAESQPAQQQVG